MISRAFTKIHGRPRNKLSLFCVLIAFAISACGGGGGDAPASPPPPPPPPALGSNANLAMLTVSDALLEQPFDTATVSYSAAVGFLIDSITVNAVAEDPSATITVNGVPLDAAGEMVLLGEGINGVSLQVTAENGTTTRVYMLEVTRQPAASFAQDAYLKASNAELDDHLGTSVALSGDTLAVSATEEDGDGVGGELDNGASASGAVYVFARDNAGVWSQQAYLKASNAEAGDSFGVSLALSGDMLAIGAHGEDGNGVSGELDNSASSAGAVYMFNRNNMGDWSQQAYLKASNAEAGDFFGISVALSGDTLAVGARFEDGNGVGGEMDNSADGAGAAYVFLRDNAGNWSQQAYLKASNPEAADDFGISLGLSGDTLAVSAISEDGNGVSGDMDNSASDAGAVYVFNRDNMGAWTPQAYIKASNAEENDRFGESVALSGDTLAIGARFEDGNGVGGEMDNSANGAGAVYVFNRDSLGAWAQQAYLKASNAEAADSFGVSVALSADTLAVGASGEDGSAVNTGAVYLFSRNTTGAWTEQAILRASNADASDVFGGSVALSGDLLAASAFAEDGNGVAGESDNSESGAGAVYTFGGTPSRNAQLASLSVNGFSLDQIFQPAQASYTTGVGFLATMLQLILDADNPVTVRVNGMLASSADIELMLNDGATVFDIEITAEDGVTTFAYTLTVTRETANSFAQRAYLKASNAEAADVFGVSVALSGDTLAVSATEEDGDGVGGEGDNSASRAGAVYVFSRDETGVWSQQAYLKASNAEDNDRFGHSAALSGDTLAVGAEGEDGNRVGGEADNSAGGAGAVYIFTRDGSGTWRQQDYLKASNTEPGDRFGRFVALSDDTLAVGADGKDGNAGAVFVFARNSAGTWSQRAILRASNADSGDFFGFSGALSGDTLAVGAYGEAGNGVSGELDNRASLSGAVYVFARDITGTWSQEAYLKASNAEQLDLFSFSVALSGNTLVVGAIGEDGNGANGEMDNNAINAGAVYVFTRDNSGNWSQQAYLKASNTDVSDRFGRSAALSGDTLAVGASGEDGNGTGGEMDNSASGAGAVYVFTRSAGGAWIQQAYLKASNAETADSFGGSMALSGDTLAIGAADEDGNGVGGDTDNSASSAGAVYIWQ